MREGIGLMGSTGSVLDGEAEKDCELVWDWNNIRSEKVSFVKGIWEKASVIEWGRSFGMEMETYDEEQSWQPFRYVLDWRSWNEEVKNNIFFTEA